MFFKRTIRQEKLIWIVMHYTSENNQYTIKPSKPTKTYHLDRFSLKPVHHPLGAAHA